jgi:hypothetical protein
MERLRRFLKDYPAIGVALVLFLVYAGTAAAQQAMKLSDGTFATKVVVYTLDGSPASAGAGDASAANQSTQITHLAAIETATESAQSSLDNIEASLSADAVAGNAAIATGPQLMAYGKATAPTAVDADDAVQVWADLNGRLQMNTAQINGVAPSMGNGASGTGVQRVTIASDSTGVIGATQSGTWTVQPGNTANTTAWLVTNAASASGNGCTPGSSISAAAVLETEIKATAGQLYQLVVTNIDATPVFAKLYNDTAANTDETDTPIQRFVVPAQSDAGGGGFVLPIPIGMVFSTAITLRVTTGAADNNTGALTASEVLVSYCYK